MGINIRIHIFLLFACTVIAVGDAFGQTKTEKKQYEKAIKLQRINTDKALMHIASVFSTVTNSSNLSWKAKVTLAKAKIHLSRGELDLAIEHALQAHKIYFHLKNQKGISEANLLLCQSYSITKNFEKSEKCIRQVERYAKENNIKSLQIEVLNCKGNNCFQALENEKAMAYYREAEEKVKTIHNPYLATKIQNNIANILVNIGKQEEALPIYKHALKEYKELNCPLDELLVLYNIGRQFRSANMLDSSLYYCNLCLDLGRKVHSLEDIAYAYSAFEVTYSLLGDYKKALESNELFHTYKDSLASSANNALITRLETDYELRLNKEIIDRQQKRIMINSRKTANILGVLVFTLILFVLGAFYYRKSRKLNRALQQSNSEILEQNKTIDTALHEKEILLKEVHHRVKNSLQIVSSLLNLQESQLTDEIAIEALKNSKTRIQTIALMHQSLYQRDADLGMVSSSSYLKNILELQLEALSDQKNPVTTTLKLLDLELSIDHAVPLGLIASEIINNALKYAYVDLKKPLLKIETYLNENQLELLIEDNGKGFEHQDIKSQYSLGLEIVEALTEQLRGKMNCITGKTGTKFIFQFPL